MKKTIGAIMAAAILAITLLAFGYSGAAGDVTLVWEYPDAETINGFVVGFGPESMCEPPLSGDDCQFPHMIDIADPAARTSTIPRARFESWPSDRVFFRIAAYRDAVVDGDQIRLHSQWSNEATSIIATLLRPDKPAGLNATPGTLVIIK